MASEVEQKYLGMFAKQTAKDQPELSAALYKVLGLSTLLQRKLVRARKQRKLDPTRPTKSLDLYRHINWMGREGYAIIETIIPMVVNEVELRVLIFKLKASFLHVFALFEFSPRTKMSVLSTIQQQQQQNSNNTNQTLKDVNYIKPAMEAFRRAYELAKENVPGIHPLRLGVVLEYSAFMFDCIRDHEEARRMAKKGVEDALDVVTVLEDDEMFSDAQDLVGSLVVLAKRATPATPQLPQGPINGAGEKNRSLGDSPTQSGIGMGQHTEEVKRRRSKTTYDLNGNVLKTGK
ncbi:14-3-3 domain-containing protein [Peziza echinospora]|nr:14-3-3 domain-containing protein [Peziza echinospora]